MNRAQYPIQTSPKFMMRLPSSLHGRVKSAAKANSRSMNGEIVHTLELAYPTPVVAESVNQELLDASRFVLEQWSGMIEAIGQRADDNPALARLVAAIESAELSDEQA